MTFIPPSSPITTNSPPLKLTYVTPFYSALRGTSVASACPQSSPLFSSVGNHPFPHLCMWLEGAKPRASRWRRSGPSVTAMTSGTDMRPARPTQCTSQPQDFAGSLRKEVCSSVLRLLRGLCTNQELLVSPCEPICDTMSRLYPRMRTKGSRSSQVQEGNPLCSQTISVGTLVLRVEIPPPGNQTSVQNSLSNLV